MTAELKLIQPAELAEQLNEPDLVVIDLCPEGDFIQAHVPGARFLPPQATQNGRPPRPGDLPDAGQLERIVAWLGLTQDSRIVVMDHEGGGWTGRMLWLLASIGVKSAAALDGGRVAWLAEGYPTEYGEPSPANPPGTLPIRLTSAHSISAEQLKAALEAGEVQVWDARSRDEFEGVRGNALRLGHIPGAIHMEWTELMDPARHLRLKPLDTIRDTLIQRGLNPECPVVTHCQTHHRSGLTWLAGQLMGLNIRAYPGSWSEWGNREDTPVTA
ncbi:MAG: sulfurtransferase [Gammaproteobacteria bacterium]|nr:MAG: sulfurtransferase [Gammaproteobacteria bacterium]